MISDELIQRGGSKLEITRAIIESGLNIPVPNSAYLYYGQKIGSLFNYFNDMKKPVIVRGSHPNDYQGFIDVVPTKRDVNTWEELEEAVKYIYRTMKSEDVKIHAEDWGQVHSPEVHILLQEQVTNIVGSMIRHPHDGSFRIQYYNINNRADFKRECISNADNRYGKLRHASILNELTQDARNLILDEDLMQLISIYELLEKSGIVDQSYSQLMEFGLKPFSFFQGNPFKKFEAVKNFEIPFIEIDSGIPYMSTMDCFGITPPEGIDLKFISVDSHGLHKMNKYKSDEYGLILTEKINSTPRTRQRLGNLVCYCTPSYYDYLMHHEYRFMKRANYSFTHSLFYNFKNCSVYHLEDMKVFEHSRIYSNGKKGIIIPTKFI
jgi:hypothetical protein